MRRTDDTGVDDWADCWAEGKTKMTQEELLDRLAVLADRIAVQATERPIKNAMVVFGPSTTPDEIRTWEAEVNLWIADGWQPYGFAWEQAGTIKLVMVKR